MKNNFGPTAFYFTILLIQSNIKFHVEPLYDGYQWRFDDYRGDVCIHSGTYHSDEGFLESFQMPWDNDDVSICTPIEMVRRLKGEEAHVMGERKYTIDDAVNSMKIVTEMKEDD